MKATKHNPPRPAPVPAVVYCVERCDCDEVITVSAVRAAIREM